MDEDTLLAQARRISHACAADGRTPSLTELTPGVRPSDWSDRLNVELMALLDSTGEQKDDYALPWHTIDSLTAMPSEPVVVDRLMRRGEVVMLAGPPKARKTWAALDLALAVASGDRWLNEYETGDPVNVGYMDYECQGWLLGERLSSLMMGRATSRMSEVQKHLHIATMRGRSCMTFEQLRSQLTAAIDSRKCSLLVIDTLTRCTVLQDENDNAEVTQLGATLAQVSGETGASLLLVHHTAKGASRTRSVAESGSGAGAFGRIPDSVARLSLDEEGMSRLDLVSRSFPPTDPMSIDWPIGSRPRARPVDEPLAEPSPRRSSRA